MKQDELELMDGRTIVGYPKSKEEQMSWKISQCPDAGHHIKLKGKTSALIKEERQKAQDRLQKLFLNNAFNLLKHHERILSDSRMFLTQVPIESGLAYVGAKGFSNPTLGVYLEWWLNCPFSSMEDKDGSKWLIYKLAGSPLTGRNECGLVDKNGNIKHMNLQTFRPAWESFVSINRRYKEAKEKYCRFSLLQTMTLLEKEGKAVVVNRNNTFINR